MSLGSYQDLEVWQKSMEFVIDCYKISKGFPSHELYGLTSQLRRAAVSIPSNIAEGHGRIHTKELTYHLSIAHGSLIEAQTQLRIAHRLGYLARPNLTLLLESSWRIGQMLTKFIMKMSEN